jgi:hypothetical protein
MTFFKLFFMLPSARSSDTSGKTNGVGKRNSPTLSEVVTLNLLRFYMRVQDLKTFHRLVGTHYRGCFPELPNYENFLKATNRSGLFISLLVKYVLHMNSRGNDEHFEDSTNVLIFENHNICNYRIAKETAGRGKTLKGWF